MNFQRIKWFYALILVIYLTIPGLAQNYTKIKFDKHSSGYKSMPESVYPIQIDTPSTGLVLAIDPADNFKGSYLIIKPDTIYLTEDEDREGKNELKYSNLVSFHSRVDSVLFYPAGIKKEITFFIIDSKKQATIKTKAKAKKKSADCSIPEMIDQTEWRAGLPDPDYQRIHQKVQNIIIHHTAGSNSDTDYTVVVRNIYVYHTQIRGWSDIGYNYLIAQSGTIFKGRDPGEYEQDNVMGAHFCNNNSGTMGISIMGTYTDVVPPDTALQSLIALVSWKLGKEHLDPLGHYYHPLNAELPAIAGHRDGCSTECPGNSLYAILDSLRNMIMAKFNDCGYVINSTYPISGSLPKLIIRQSKNQIELNSVSSAIELIRLYDLMGRQISAQYTQAGNGEILLTPDLKSKGIIILICKTSDAYYSEKIIL
jgi:hypothetical protein